MPPQTTAKSPESFHSPGEEARRLGLSGKEQDIRVASLSGMVHLSGSRPSPKSNKIPGVNPGHLA